MTDDLVQEIARLKAIIAEATVKEEDHETHDGAYWKALRDAQLVLNKV